MMEFQTQARAFGASAVFRVVAGQLATSLASQHPPQRTLGTSAHRWEALCR